MDDLIDGMGRQEEQEAEQDDRFEAEHKQRQPPPQHLHRLHGHGVALKAAKEGSGKKKSSKALVSGPKQRPTHSRDGVAAPPARPDTSASSSNAQVERPSGGVDRGAQPVNSKAKKSGGEGGVMRAHGGGRERSSIRAADTLGSAAVLAPITAEDEEQVMRINALMRDSKGRGEKLSLHEMRRLLKVSSELTAFIDAEWAVEGQVHMDAWPVMKAAAKVKRAQWKSRARQEKKAMKDDEDHEEGEMGRGKAIRGEKRTAEGSGEGAKPKKRKKPAIGEGDSKDLSFDGWRRLPKSKSHKKKQPGQSADDDDFEQLIHSEAVQQRKRSLRSRKQINYSAQLEESTRHKLTSLAP